MVSGRVRILFAGRCAKCGRRSRNAGCSHYFSRRYIGTRWDLKNLVWACWTCHFHWLEKEKNPGGWYHNYMLKKLGEEEFEKLKIKAYTINKFSTSDLEILESEFEKGNYYEIINLNCKNIYG